MIEIRIPKEIKNYREKLFFGLTLCQCICAGVALLICVPLYIFGNKFLPQEAVSWLVLIIAAPSLRVILCSFKVFLECKPAFLV